MPFKDAWSRMVIPFHIYKERGSDEIPAGFGVSKNWSAGKSNPNFSGLIDRGQGLLSGDNRTDFFEKFSGDENENARKANANYLIGLANWGSETNQKLMLNLKKI